MTVGECSLLESVATNFHGRHGREAECLGLFDEGICLARNLPTRVIALAVSNAAVKTLLDVPKNRGFTDAGLHFGEQPPPERCSPRHMVSTGGVNQIISTLAARDIRQRPDQPAR